MILYYTHRKFGESKIVDYCFKRLWGQSVVLNKKLMAIVPSGFGLQSSDNFNIINYDTPEGGDKIQDIYNRILIGLEHCEDDEIVWLAEHDVLYTDEHFQHSQPELGYNLNYTYLSRYGFFQRHSNCLALSQLVGRADLMRVAIELKLNQLKDGCFSCYEPNGILKNFRTVEPAIDIRHDFNQSWHVDPSVDKFWDTVPNSKYWLQDATTMWKEITGEEV